MASDKKTPPPADAARDKLRNLRRELKSQEMQAEAASKPKVSTFDPGDLLDQALANNLDPAILDALDDRWVAKPPNIFRWVNSKQFLGLEPFARQLKILVELHGDLCFSERCTDLRFWDNIQVDTPLSAIQDRTTFLDFGKCPRCKKTRLDFANEGRRVYHEELVGVGGQRLGKSIMVAGMIASYHMARFLCLPSPTKTFGLLPGELQFTFCALTKEQAHDNLWTYFDNIVQNSPWFTMLHKFLRDEGKRLGVELYQYPRTFLRYRHKSLYCHFTGAEFQKQRGRTRAFAAIDELGLWDHTNKTRVSANPREVHASLSNSMRSIRSAAQIRCAKGQYDLPTGLMANISSPFDVDDEIMKLLYEAQDPEKGKKMYSFHYATHEVNPNQPYEILKQEAKNNEAFERDFLAIPPLSNSPFIGDKTQLDKIFHHTRPQLVTVQETSKATTHLGETGSFFWYKVHHADGEPSIPRCIAIDAGERQNSFAAAMGFYDNVEDTGVIEQVWELQPTQNKRVYFPGMVEDFLKPLIDQFYIRYVVCDQWNQASFVHPLESYKKGTEAEAYSLTFQDLTQIKGNILGNQIVFPFTNLKLTDYNPAQVHEVFLNSGPVARLKLQLATVRAIGKKVIKPKNGTDDLFRAMCLCMRQIYEHKEEFADYQLGVARRHGKHTGQPWFAFRRGTGQWVGSGSSVSAVGNSGMVSMRKSNGGAAPRGPAPGRGHGRSRWG